MADENIKVFFDENDVRVTGTRLQVGATMFPLTGVTSVSLVKLPGSYGVVILLLLVAMGILFYAMQDFSSGGLIWPGLILLVVAGVLASRVKPKFAVAIATAGGQQNVVVSDQEAFIRRIITALNDAIEARG